MRCCSAGPARGPRWWPSRCGHRSGLLGHDWLGHPTLFRTALVADACSAPLGPAWEHDLALRVASRARSAVRVAQPLLRGPGREPATTEATTHAMAGLDLARLGVSANVEPGAVPGSCRVRRTVPEELSVALVIACRGARGLALGQRRWFVVEAARTALRRAGHANLEAVVVHQRILEPSVLNSLLTLGERVRLVTHPALRPPG